MGSHILWDDFSFGIALQRVAGFNLHFLRASERAREIGGGEERVRGNDQSRATSICPGRLHNFLLKENIYPVDATSRWLKKIIETRELSRSFLSRLARDSPAVALSERVAVRDASYEAPKRRYYH